MPVHPRHPACGQAHGDVVTCQACEGSTWQIVRGVKRDCAACNGGRDETPAERRQGEYEARCDVEYDRRVDDRITG